MTVIIVSKGGAWARWHPGPPGDRATSTAAADQPRCSNLIEAWKSLLSSLSGLRSEDHQTDPLSSILQTPRNSVVTNTEYIQFHKMRQILNTEYIQFMKNDFKKEYWIPLFGPNYSNSFNNSWQHCPGHGDWLRCWPNTHRPDQIYDQGASFYILFFLYCVA